MNPPLLSLTESQTFAALRTLISQSVRSAEFVGEIAGNILTVSEVFNGKVYVNQLIADTSGQVVDGTQISGCIAANGLYLVTPAQNTPNLFMYGSLEVIKGQINRVPEPNSADYVLLIPLRQETLAWNITTYADNIFTGSIIGNTLTVSGTRNAATLAPGMLLADAVGNVLPGSTLGKQVSGVPGGNGSYRVYPAQNVTSEAMYAGQRLDMTPTKVTIQVEVHGPWAADNVKMIKGLFWSDYGYQAMIGFGVAPLYASEPRQIPFLDAEQQYEYCWEIDMDVQVDPVIATTQQFADAIKITTKAVDLSARASSLSLATNSGTGIFVLGQSDLGGTDVLGNG